VIEDDGSRLRGAPRRPLRLGTFNLLSGRSLTGGRFDADGLAAAVDALDADVLAIQEVDRCQPRSGRVDQAEFVGERMGAVERRFVTTVAGTPGESGWRSASRTAVGGSAAGPDRPGYGVALLSRRPVVEWHELRLRPAPGRYPLVIPSSPPRVAWLHDEPRAAIAAVLAEPRVTIACTHLSFVLGWNLAQLAQVRRWLETLPAPRVLMGDLNLPGPLARWVTGWRPLVTRPTYPSPAPRLQLDHVLIDRWPAGARAQGTVHHLPISDHLAVRVDLELPLPEPS
jgi:endonuclease/exonuclease/phosphatase family metal-dependent hydrolase